MRRRFRDILNPSLLHSFPEREPRFAGLDGQSEVGEPSVSAQNLVVRALVPTVNLFASLPSEHEGKLLCGIHSLTNIAGNFPAIFLRVIPAAAFPKKRLLLKRADHQRTL